MPREQVLIRFARLLVSRAGLRGTVWAVLAAGAAMGCAPQIRSAAPMPPRSDAPVPGAPAGITAFVDVAVIPMDQEQTLPEQTVLVQGGRIIALGPVAQMLVPAGATQIDGQGKYLIPGLADMHIHLGANGGDSVSAERALFLLLAYGVTTVRNMDYRPKGMGAMGLDGAFLLRLRARAASGALLSPRIYTSYAWGPPEYIGGGIPPRLDSVAAYVAAYKAAGYDFVKIHDEAQVAADAVMSAAYRVGIPALGHPRASSAYDNPVMATYGATLPVLGHIPFFSLQTAHTHYKSVEHLINYFRPGMSPEDLDVNRLRFINIMVAQTQRAGVWQCPTLNWTEEGGGLTPSMARLIISEMQEAGVGLLSGTDACASKANGILGPTLHRELMLLVQAGLTPYQALVTSTRNVATYFGTLKESGTVAVGKRADLVLLDGNPLLDITNTQRIAGVMIGGRWLSRETLAPRVTKEMAAVGQ